jgi:hypothetical protein
MVERCQDLGFATKARESFSIGGECSRKDLQRHVPIQLDIARAVDLAHAAAAEQHNDFVRSEACAGNQSHTLSRLSDYTY